MRLLPVLGLLAALHAGAQGTADPLKSDACGLALSRLQAARAPGSGRLPGDVEALRREATQACLGGNGDARRPRADRPRGRVRHLGTAGAMPVTARTGRADSDCPSRPTPAAGSAWRNARSNTTRSTSSMGNKIVTEADRRRSPAPARSASYTPPRAGNGQKISLERGTATRNKKNPGKRPHQGG